MIGTLVVGGWAVTFGTSRRGLGWAAARPDPSRCTNVTIPLSTASVPTSYYSMWHYNRLLESKGMFIATQLNSTDPIEQRTAKSVVFLFMTSRPTN